MKIGLIPLTVTVLALAGCASPQAVVPSLNGAQRVPVNHEIPASAPYTAPQNTTTDGGTP